MSWILVAVIAYFFLAIVNLVDKFLLQSVLGSSKVYAFLISVMGAVVVVFAPWFLHWPGTGMLIVQLLVGMLFPIALIFMFEALKRGDASKITVLIGGFIPLLTIIFSLLIWQEQFSVDKWLGMGLLLLGTFALALVGRGKTSEQKSFNRQAVLLSLVSAIFYALFFIGTKYSYNHHDFYSSFIWIRFGSVLAVILLLLSKKNRQEIFGGLKKQNQKPKGKSHTAIIFGNQALGAVAFILQNWAINGGSVAVVNALQGVQYAFLLLFGWVLTVFRPKIIKENIARSVVIKKIGAIVLITLGIYFVIR
jgi:drug/metabolite transporter (DMT)-like permease